MSSTLGLYRFKIKISKAMAIISCEFMRCRSSVQCWATTTTTNSRHTYIVLLHKHKSILASHTRVVAKEKLVLGAIRTTTAKQQRRSTTRYVWNSPQK